MFSTVLQNYQAIINDCRNPATVSSVELVTAVTSALCRMFRQDGTLAPNGVTTLEPCADGVEVVTVWPDNNVHLIYHERSDYSHSLNIYFPKAVVSNVDQYEHSALTEALHQHKVELVRAVRYYLNVPVGYCVTVVPNELPASALFSIEISSSDSIE